MRKLHEDTLRKEKQRIALTEQESKKQPGLNIMNKLKRKRNKLMRLTKSLEELENSDSYYKQRKETYGRLQRALL